MTPKGDNTTELEPDMSFEEAFRKLEETAQTLEEGKLTLDETTRLYEEGMSLAKLCNQLLRSTELKITELKNAYSEETADIPLEDQNFLASS